MSISYEEHGRTRQKARTRAALLEATRELLAAGASPTVEDAAALAGVSRATAYRYFPNQRALLVAAHPEVEAASLLGDDAPADLQARLERAVRELVRLTLDTEPELRAMLRISLESEATQELVLRRGRAIGWLHDALAPLEGVLPERELRHLVLAIRTACGIEALVWLTDVAGLSRPQAAEQMRWSALALLRGATRDA
ncbi:MAG TPA: helix-turn-helix domain-containing protein [Baekduia sp.]|nr:helix-turn-helix domain-containing protein [Baekduia sp.]